MSGEVISGPAGIFDASGVVPPSPKNYKEMSDLHVLVE